MKRSYVAFDIETAKILPQAVQDLKAHRPLGITCAATLAAGDEEPRLWHGTDTEEAPAKQMDQAALGTLLDYLAEKVREGFTIVTWNGLSFDFDILAEESGHFDVCRDLALGHVDMMFHIVCDRGFPLGMETAAQGMGLTGKKAGVTGWQAPQMWADGKHQEVLDYVAQDARTTLDIATACETQGSLRWQSRSGKQASMPLRKGWHDVQSATQLPLPDTSWMKKPINRSDFLTWTENS